jgi:hypothetical protein
MRRFFVRDRGIAKQFQRTKKCGGEKPCRGQSPNTVFRSPSRESGEAHTDLLCAVWAHDYFLLNPQLNNC